MQVFARGEQAKGTFFTIAGYLKKRGEIFQKDFCFERINAIQRYTESRPKKRGTWILVGKKEIQRAALRPKQGKVALWLNTSKAPNTVRRFGLGPKERPLSVDCKDL